MEFFLKKKINYVVLKVTFHMYTSQDFDYCVTVKVVKTIFSSVKHFMVRMAMDGKISLLYKT